MTPSEQARADLCGAIILMCQEVLHGKRNPKFGLPDIITVADRLRASILTGNTPPAPPTTEQAE